jgi:hypothetical protein
METSSVRDFSTTRPIEVGTLPYRAAAHAICSLHYTAIERKVMLFTGPFPIGRYAVDIRREPANQPLVEELVIMTIPTATYHGHELRAYASQKFPPFDDPYAQGERRFSSVVRIDTIPFSEADARRYSTVFDATSPATINEAIDRAMQFGKDIVDGKVQAAAL